MRCPMFVATGLLSLLGAPSWAGAVTFQDSEFLDQDWTVVELYYGTGGSWSASHSATGGNPDAYRIVNTVVNAAGSENSAVWSFHFRTGAGYDPAASGPIASLDYAESAICSGPGGAAGQATGPAIRQAGDIYYAQGIGTGNLGVWVEIEWLGVEATDFARVDGSGVHDTQHPDFSAGGAPLEFGFVRANSQAPGFGGYAKMGGIDNWSVTIVPDPAVSAGQDLPVSTWAQIKALYAEHDDRTPRPR